MKMIMKFANRDEFRTWLETACEMKEGIWIEFSKHAKADTLKASEALEEALCYGWIDGQMQRIDQETYIKYFCCRRDHSKWSEKNKALVEKLEKAGRMSEFGRKKVTEAKQNGQWDAPKAELITDEHISKLATILEDFEPAYTNFLAMSPSVKKTYTRAYFDAKTGAGRLQRLSWMVERLHKNLKPM